jgi:RNA polymerase sigma-70 factor (ECF subfamily)
MDRTLSFAEIYREHAEAVYRLAWLLSGNRSEAEDLTSEAFARALAGSGPIQQATVRSYLYAIVRNLVSSRLRRPVIELPADDEQFGNTPDTDAGPEQRSEIRQRLAHASAGLAAMRESDRHVLLLCGVHGLSNLEIADALGIGAAHVRVRLHRARQQLAAFIQQQGTSNEHP